MERNIHDELIALATEWDRAMVENDVAAIGRYMADDWTIIGSDGSVGDKASFLALVESGVLLHDVMESHDMRVRVYGDAAVVVSRGVSGGTYQGSRFASRTGVLRLCRNEERWRCVLTHLSRLSQGTSALGGEVVRVTEP